MLNKPNPKGVYGNSLSNGITRDVTQLLKNPDKYLNEEILARGIIIEACPIRDARFKFRMIVFLVTFELK